jgi:ABC-2 type transport system ATP-binding protein
MKPVFQVEHLTKIYPGKNPVTANDDISLTIESGAIWGVFGPNGAGKTTLVRQMLGLLRPTGGRVLLDGQDISTQPDLIALQVGYLPQIGQAIWDFTVDEALKFTGRLRGLGRAASCAEAARLMEEWQLGPLRSRVIRRMSGGQQRLAGLVSILMGRPRVLVLDEPTNFMDPALRHLVWDRLLSLNWDAGVTIVLVTHNVLEAETVVSRVGIVANGRLLAQGAPLDLRAGLGGVVHLDLSWRVVSPETAAAAVAFMDGLAPCARRLDDTRWRVTVERAAADEVVQRLMACASLADLADLRLHGTTLEDYYLAVTANGGDAEAGE